VDIYDRGEYSRAGAKVAITRREKTKSRLVPESKPYSYSCTKPFGFNDILQIPPGTVGITGAAFDRREPVPGPFTNLIGVQGAIEHSQYVLSNDWKEFPSMKRSTSSNGKIFTGTIWANDPVLGRSNGVPECMSAT